MTTVVQSARHCYLSLQRGFFMNKDTQVKIRKIKAEDLKPIVALFKETVHHVNARDYTPEQLLVWAPHHAHHHLDRWQSMLNNIAYLVEIGDVIVGFADITREGYLDRLFVHKEYQRQGIASMLVHKLESLLFARGGNKITTEASITAKPFFEQMGYVVVQEQNKPRLGGVTLTNFLMEKNLNGPLTQIDFLKNHPKVIPQLAALWHQILGSIWTPDASYEQIKQGFYNELNDSSLPLTLVALKGIQVVGAVSLQAFDEIRADLTPWLESLVVDKTYQNQGIGKILVSEAKQKARDLHFKKLYLFAFELSLVRYYEKLGFKCIGVDKFKERVVTIMESVL